MATVHPEAARPGRPSLWRRRASWPPLASRRRQWASLTRGSWTWAFTRAEASGSDHAFQGFERNHVIRARDQEQGTCHRSSVRARPSTWCPSSRVGIQGRSRSPPDSSPSSIAVTQIATPSRWTSPPAALRSAHTRSRFARTPGTNSQRRERATTAGPRAESSMSSRPTGRARSAASADAAAPRRSNAGPPTARRISASASTSATASSATTSTASSNGPSPASTWVAAP